MQPTKIDLTAVRADWAASGFTFEIWIDPPSQVWHDFLHDVDELVFRTEGESGVVLPGRTVGRQGGGDFFLRGVPRHTIRNTGKGAARWAHGFREPPAAIG